jgi:hypothetical protein
MFFSKALNTLGLFGSELNICGLYGMISAYFLACHHLPMSLLCSCCVQSACLRQNVNVLLIPLMEIVHLSFCVACHL